MTIVEWQQQSRLPGAQHIYNVRSSLDAFESQLQELHRWGCEWATALMAGGRLLAAGNGGSAAEAQHLTAELVGRYDHDRPAFSAIALHAETSTTTALCNDYGPDAIFARSVEAHGRTGDVLVLLSTSGCSSNLLTAAEAARKHGVVTYALTGPGVNPLSARCDNALLIEAPTPAAVQELQLIAIHLICEAFDSCVDAAP